MVPHFRVDDADSDRSLSVIAFLSPSLRIEPIVTLLREMFFPQTSLRIERNQI
jgi:hypothetical protein